MNWLVTIVGIMVLIVLHELGHFAVAKAVGMRVEKFSLFFPPSILRHRRGETEYAIGAIPLGGYVKITGMNPDEIADLPPEIAARAYYNQPPWKRIAVILAGPGVNIAIAFILFWAVLASGSLPGAVLISALDRSSNAVVETTSVQEIEPGHPAQGKLLRGDRILTVDGRPATVESAMHSISSHRCAGAQVQGCTAATPVQLTVRRGGRVLDVSVYPRYDSQAKRMLVGFEFGAAAASPAPLPAAAKSLGVMWQTTTDTVSGLGRALTSSTERSKVSSIVGITQAGAVQVEAGPGRALVFLGYLSLILGVLNLFPFLPLDGGHVLWALAEKIRGRRVSLMAMYRFSSVGILLMVFLVINGISNDISRLAG